jgi:hypothetical protein
VPQHEELSILGHLALRHHYQAAEQTAHEQVANREDDSATISASESGQLTRADRVIDPYKVPAGTAGPKMTRLRREDHRLLGNGWCTRSPQLDCAFEYICETCTYFQASIEFRPALRRGRRMPATSVHRSFRPPVDPSGNGVVGGRCGQVWWSGYIGLGVLLSPHAN